ncbi:carbonic anhydrase [Piscinibacter sp.]|uniref:carbonic anhydrase n=1 Tax=Piscinibacter sp. TaxID=1903157 RepID=UPI002CE4F12E|nr:carbonic anhydrase family protein [Albitalea sp.]HUG22408.1 carbonic anhydrase family protein [Albitalea sp.]
MAKPTPAPAAAPVPDPEGGAEEGVASPKRFRLPRLPFRISLSRKKLIVGAAAVFGVGTLGGAAYLFWPEPETWPRQALPKIQPAKAASAPMAVAEAVPPAASQPQAAASDVADVHAAAASEPENPMDKLRRRLSETLGDGGKIEDDGPGELRLTTRRPANPVAAAAATGTPAARFAAAGGAADTGPAPQPKSAASHWTYQGATGPEVWGRLKPEFAKCATGKRQSPIDLHDGIRVDLEPVRFDYRPSAFRVIDNGHTVQVNVAPGNHIEVLGRRYELQQFHFHRPSEERIAGRQFDMDAHLVHKDDEGRLAVVAVLLERGGAQPVVQTVWNNLPLEKGEEQPARVNIDLNELLPADRGYFIYMGSLTTPPCSEGVVWMVMKTPVGISDDQLGIFSRLYPMNARPIQSAGRRMVKESN